MSKSINVNYKSILASSVAANKTVEQIKMSFRPGGKENMVAAMKEIVEELKGIDDAQAKAIVTMAKQIMEPKEKVSAVVTEVPWWQAGQKSEVKSSVKLSNITNETRPRTMKMRLKKRLTRKKQFQ